MKNTKQEWKKQAQSFFTDCIDGILKRSSVKNTIRFEIIGSNVPEKAQQVSGCTVSTYKYEQHYEFYLENCENSVVTNVYVYQDEMSKEHTGLHAELSTEVAFAKLEKLDDDSFKAYRDSIVWFLMANLVWK